MATLQEAYGPAVQTQGEFDKLASTGKYAQLKFELSNRNLTSWRTNSNDSYNRGSELTYTNGMNIMDLQTLITVDSREVGLVATRGIPNTFTEEALHAILIRNAIKLHLPVPSAGIKVNDQPNYNPYEQHGLLRMYKNKLNSIYLLRKNGLSIIYK